MKGRKTYLFFVLFLLGVGFVFSASVQAAPKGHYWTNRKTTVIRFESKGWKNVSYNKKGWKYHLKFVGKPTPATPVVAAAGTLHSRQRVVTKAMALQLGYINPNKERPKLKNVVHTINRVTAPITTPVVNFTSFISTEASGLFPWLARQYRLYQGYKKGHAGLDINPPMPGQKGVPVENLADGTVWLVKNNHATYGNYMSFDHGSHFCELGHFAPNSMVNPRTGAQWQVGDHLSKGDVVAKMGMTGNAENYHTHYQCREKKANGKPGKLVNPTKCHPELKSLKYRY
jgi:hypothetical protein